MVECPTFQDLMAVVEEGVRNRRVASHDLNKDSSRSHSIFTVFIDMETVDLVDGYSSKKFGKIHFVDLAGSERLKESKSQGSTAIETGHINKSLLTLSKVISLLGSSRRSSSHVPFRDSKLTQLLMDSIGGGCKTILIACITPSLYHVDETMNTLKYASRAKKIKNRPVINMNPNEALIAHLRHEIKILREEISVLRRGTSSPNSSMPPENEHRSNRCKDHIKLNNPFYNKEKRRTIGRLSPIYTNHHSSKLDTVAGFGYDVLPSLDPQYAQILAENERLEMEVRSLREMIQSDLRPKQNLNQDGIVRLKRENVELLKELEQMRENRYEITVTEPFAAFSTQRSFDEASVLSEEFAGIKRNLIFFSEQNRALRILLYQHGIEVDENELHENAKKAVQQSMSQRSNSCKEYRLPKQRPRRQPEMDTMSSLPPLNHSPSPPQSSIQSEIQNEMNNIDDHFKLGQVESEFDGEDGDEKEDQKEKEQRGGEQSEQEHQEGGEQNEEGEEQKAEEQPEVEKQEGREERKYKREEQQEGEEQEQAEKQGQDGEQQQEKKEQEEQQESEEQAKQEEEEEEERVGEEQDMQAEEQHVGVKQEEQQEKVEQEERAEEQQVGEEQQEQTEEIENQNAEPPVDNDAGESQIQEEMRADEPVFDDPNSENREI